MIAPLSFQEKITDQGANKGGPSRSFFRWLYLLRELLNGNETDIASLTTGAAGGELIENVALLPFVDNTIPHSLGQDLKQWTIVRDQAVKGAAFGTRGSAQVIATGGGETLTFDGEEYDDGNNLNAATGIYTCPVAGLLRASCGVTLVGILDVRMFLDLVVQGSTVKRFGDSQRNGSTSNNGMVNADGWDIRVSAGDLVRWDLFHDHGSDRSTASNPNTTNAQYAYVKQTEDDQDSNLTPEDTLVLRTTYAHTVSLWVR